MMGLPMILTLGFHILLCQEVSLLRYSIIHNQTSTLLNIDNIFGQFLDEWRKVYAKKNNPWQVIITGPSIEHLDHAQSFFQSYPYNVCTNPKKYVHRENFGSRSLFIVFLDDLTEKNLIKNEKIFSHCMGECHVLFISKGTYRSDEILPFFNQIVLLNIVHFELVQLCNDSVQLHRPINVRNCNLGLMPVLKWRPGTDLSKIDAFFTNENRDMYGCPITIDTIKSIPSMIIEKDRNGTLTIVGGREGMLVLIIAEKLNFRPVVKYPPRSSNSNASIKDVMLEEVSAGIAHFAIGRLRPTNTQLTTIAYSNSYDDECLTWGVPRIIKSTGNVVWTEFPWEGWAFIGLVFILSCATEYIHYNINLSSTVDRKRVGFLTILLDVLSINLGNPVIHVSLSTRGKLMLTTYLLYSLVVTTAYKTSLASILTTVGNSPAIDNQDQIYTANLKVGGSRYNIDIFKGQDNLSESSSKLVGRLETIHSNSNLMNRLKFDGDFACLIRRAILSYEKGKIVKAQELMTFHILNDCVLSYPTIIAFNKRSFLRHPINKVLQQIIESGILDHWDNASYAAHKKLERSNANKFSEAHVKQKFGNVFILYCGCCVLCLLVFFVELLIPKFKLKKIQR